jgi:Predicted permeases
MLVGGVAAGVFGSLLGLGGGLLIVPLLTIGFGLPLREAVGVSLVCVIVTSSASAGVFLERRQANLRLGMTLELFTAMGAIAGGLVAFLLDERMLAGLFAVVLLYVAFTMVRAGTAPAAADMPPENVEEPRNGPTSGVSDAGHAEVRRWPAGLAGSVGAGVVSALLGIGGGIIKVPVMHLVMGVPLRIATATSNLMIGITASASAIVYLLRGGINVYASAPTAVGVFVGASIGSRLAGRVDVRLLRLLFVAVLLFTAFEMARRAVGAS